MASELLKYSKYFIAILDNKDDNQEVIDVLKNLNKSGIYSHYPLMLNIFKEYKENKIETDDFIDIIKIIESFIIRRGLCGIPTNSLNPIFRTTWNKLDKNNLKISLIKSLKLGDGNKKWPNETEFKEALTTRNLYDNPHIHLLLEELEKYNNKEANKNFSNLTIEHVLPQTNGDAEQLSKEWKEMLGPNYKQIRDKWVHTLGNLTLTGYNSEYWANSFDIKKSMKNGFIDSGLKLNKQISDYSIWNEASIIDRAEKLAEIAINRWGFFS